MWYIRITMILLAIASALNLWTVYKFNNITANTETYLIRENHLLKIQLEERGIEIEDLKKPEVTEIPEEEIDFSSLDWQDQPARSLQEDE